MKKAFKQAIWQVPLLLLLIAADQWVKEWIYCNLRGQSPIVWIENVFELTYVENRGAAFGMLNGWSWLFYLLTPICVLLIGYLLYKSSANRKFWPAQISCLLIIAGAVGNLIDRVVRGFVVDMFYFKLINFAVFNVADSYIVVGLFLLVALLLWNQEFSDVIFPDSSKKEANKHDDAV